MSKRDWMRECNDQNVAIPDFVNIFCARCRNPDCTRAGYAGSLWSDRMSTQVERLLSNPNFADLSLPLYAQINANDFPDAMRQALRIEIANKRKDWEMPPEDIDPIAAMKELAGHTAPARATPPRHDGLEITVLTEEGEDEKAKQPATPDVASPKPSEPVRPIVTETSKQPVMLQRTNTAFPVGGMMIDGTQPTARKDKLSAPPPVADPWAAPAPVENVVPIGAKIRLGLAVSDAATKESK